MDAPLPSLKVKQVEREFFSAGNILRLARNHALLVVASLVAVFAATTFWTLGQPKLYRSEALLRIDPTPPRPLGQRVELVTSETLSWASRREFIESEIRVMRSTKVAMAVVRQLGLHMDPAFLNVRPSERATFKQVPIDVAAKVLTDRLNVESVKDATLVYLRYEDGDAKRSQKILETLVRTYLDQNLESTAALSSNALEWLNGQLKQLQGDLEKSEKALADFRLKNNVLSFSLEDKHNLLSSQLDSISKELGALEAKRAAAAARSSSLNATKTDDPLSAGATDLLASVVLSQFRQAYFVQLKEYEELSATYDINYPKVQQAKAKLDSIAKAIRTEVANIKRAAAKDLAGVEGQIADLKRRDASLQAMAHEIQVFEVPYNQLSRTKAYNEKIYGLVLERSRETGLTRMMNFSNIRVVEEPMEPRAPYKPIVPLNLAVGAVAGLLLGLGLAAIRELGDQSLKTPADVESVLGVTCIGLLPAFKESERVRVRYGRAKRMGKQGNLANLATRDLYVSEHPDSGMAEAARVIRTNLAFMSPDRPYKMVAITSAVPEEGKTTVACSLATVLAQSGLRTLLVDTDLRRPRLHRTFGVSNDVGVSVVLTGQASLEESIRETSVPNLFVLTSGPVPPTPSEMLQSEKFQKLVAELKGQFDRIIFDSPPVLPVTDATILGQLVDGVLVVARGFRTHKNAVQMALRHMADVKAPLIGVVLNAIDFAHAEYRGYYYSYGARYYGRQEEAPKS